MAFGDNTLSLLRLTNLFLIGQAIHFALSPEAERIAPLLATSVLEIVIDRLIDQGRTRSPLFFRQLIQHLNLGIANVNQRPHRHLHDMAAAIASHQLHSQIPTDGLGGARKRSEGNGFVSGIKQPIKLRAARMHPVGEFCLRNVLPLHQLGKLPSKDALDGARRHFLVSPILLKETIEG
jgi:hypothetical protein